MGSVGPRGPGNARIVTGETGGGRVVAGGAAQGAVTHELPARATAGTIMNAPATPESVRHCVVAVAREGSRFLVIRRGPTVRAPGTICFPGGHVEPGESELDAVVRECREEISIVVAPRACVWRSLSKWGAALAWWTVDIVDASAPVPHPVEVAEILWLSAEEMLDDPTLLEGNRAFIEALARGRVRV